jgi:hypothetical protein
MNIAPVFVIQIMISGNEIYMLERFIQAFQSTQSELQCLYVDAGTMMIPVTQKEACLATILLGCLYEPIDEIGAIHIVLNTIGF